MGEQLIVTLVRTWVIDLWNIFWWNIDKTSKIVCFLWKKNAPQGRQNHRMQQQICKKCKKISFFGQKTLYWGTQKNPLLRFWIFFRRRGDVTQSEESIAHALTSTPVFPRRKSNRRFSNFLNSFPNFSEFWSLLFSRHLKQMHQSQIFHVIHIKIKLHSENFPRDVK